MGTIQDATLPARAVIGTHPELREGTLPLTVPGLQTLFADIIAEVAAERHGLVSTDVSVQALIEYARARMPAVFSKEALTAGPGFAAIQSAIEHVENTPAPEGGMTWPPNPQWLARLVDEVVTPLVATFAHFNVHIPGAVELLNRYEQKLLPKVTAMVDDDGEHHARTGFLPVPDSPREAQYVLHRREGTLYFGRRFKGSRTVEPLSDIPTEAVPALIALLNWYRNSFSEPY